MEEFENTQHIALCCHLSHLQTINNSLFINVLILTSMTIIWSSSPENMFFSDLFFYAAGSVRRAVAGRSANPPSQAPSKTDSEFQISILLQDSKLKQPMGWFVIVKKFINIAMFVWKLYENWNSESGLDGT